jgi:hypothetical protein
MCAVAPLHLYQTEATWLARDVPFNLRQSPCDKPAIKRRHFEIDAY